ncbi:MAG: GntR family transcriptional regulator [Paracoccus sp. (in: a-proteobacteria)]|uniref:GntR family transcriptional regulator n=1 Tax=unclassified Paracoccus (in: a-proteobacteria) TaxID=2688777 RepID=UPI0025F565B2|nr:GntR family transcriptional regulator [Paracoccus sp. UBA889]MCS5602150.1 GntR family transcriptional regulator [Paracoccus sp. (in: a-proteobacteria)]|tara:strand:- start:4230 stop:4931 length:702 start_codon:yes stop_codon:yes gene_type:complete
MEHSKSATSTDRAYRQLRDAILSGSLPTDRKVTETGLASMLGLSRTPVRAAIGRLLIEGLLQRRSGSGLWCVLPTPGEMQEIFDIRARLESYAAARAAERASAEQREAVKQSAERMSRHVAALAKRSDPDIARRIEEENAFFHRLILEAACAPRLERLLQSTVDVAFVSLTLQRYSLGQRVRSAGHHHDIAEAIALGMAEWAARTMEAHILAAAASFRNRYGVAAETPQDDKA